MTDLKAIEAAVDALLRASYDAWHERFKGNDWRTADDQFGKAKNALLTLIRDDRRMLVELVRAARCPIPDCVDGCYPTPTAQGPEPTQCEWCFLKEAALAATDEVPHG